MMVLPIQQGTGGSKGKKWKGNKRGKKSMNGPGGDVQVNLIVDPGMLQGQRDDGYPDEYDQDGYGDNSSMPGTNARSIPQRRPRPRRSIFTGLAMEEQWRAARTVLKKVMFLDIVCALLWGAEFVLILMGKRCPSGGFEGW
jgi:hypothetical protein